MNDIKNLLNSRQVVFLGTKTIGIDRGWDPADVRKLLEVSGVHSHFKIANDIRELEMIISTYPTALYWPVCYSLSNDPKKTPIVKIFETNNIQYVGASSRSIQFSSKINFKNAVKLIPNVSTPDFKLIDSGNPIFPKSMEFSAMLKTEFSCNSEGVRKVNDSVSFLNANDELRNLHDQRHFVESWEREEEYTVAYLPASKTRKLKIAPVRLRIINNAEYIDIPTKAINALVKVETLSDRIRQDLMDATNAITGGLDIDGYCRIDFVKNKYGRLFVIELNFQPFMSYPKEVRSYFPNALIKAANLDFKDQIFQILEHAIYRAYEEAI